MSRTNLVVQLGTATTLRSCELQGYAGTLNKGDTAAVAEGEWQRAYLNSYAGTIAGGTSEIVRNILGEKVLGLPKTK